MRNRRENDQRDTGRDVEPRWLHGHHSGENSDRGNYTVDSHFNVGRGEYDQDFMDKTSFNTNSDQRYTYPEGRYQVGGAQYMGEDFTSQRRRRQDNMYGMTYVPDDDHNSQRHYDSRAKYRNTDYSDLRRQNEPRTRYGMPDERFGHDVSRSRGSRDEYLGHASMGDYESYRRYEQFDPRYDNDYSGGFAGRNYTEGATHYGEGSYYSNLDRWRSESQNQSQNQNRGRGSNRGRSNR
ncbi:hypothetical protein H8S95_03930 [Pontibacter sp. KCTC 32443]|uniref:hypothetical protein n=1 Tax=Pontibacter TaxID=323449 RepID=UPI00164E8C2D|nr:MULTISPECIES: hypothetical protein [Pontibacter]MBC5773202.1 hypothetical protein [Pontibacter sp. KCTC 32443]